MSSEAGGTGHWANPLRDGRDFRWDVLVDLGNPAADAGTAAIVGAAIDLREANTLVLGRAPNDGSVVDRHVAYLPPAALSDLIASVDVVVTRGTDATVLAALRAGVPMVVLPSDGPGRWNALAVEAAGVAVVVGSAEEIVPIVSRIALEGALVRRARTLAQRLIGTSDAESVSAVVSAALSV